MVLQNYQKFLEMTSNMIYTVAFGGDLKCPGKIHLNTQCPLCPGLHGVYVKQRVTTGPEIDSVKLKFIHIHPNWHEGGYFYLVVLFESDFAS